MVLDSREIMTVTPLSTLLEQHGVSVPIDPLSVDVEGEDLEVIRSLDWERWPVERWPVEIVLATYDVGSRPAWAVSRGSGTSAHARTGPVVPVRARLPTRPT